MPAVCAVSKSSRDTLCTDMSIERYPCVYLYAGISSSTHGERGFSAFLLFTFLLPSSPHQFLESDTSGYEIPCSVDSFFLFLYIRLFFSTRNPHPTAAFFSLFSSLSFCSLFSCDQGVLAFLVCSLSFAPCLSSFFFLFFREKKQGDDMLMNFGENLNYGTFEQQKRLAMLLGHSSLPTRDSLKTVLYTKDLLSLADENCQQLFSLIESEFTPLKLW